jgi:glyoxylase-like metal-dependent hydrolase (beta-lactamase superfamily II)
VNDPGSRPAGDAAVTTRRFDGIEVSIISTGFLWTVPAFGPGRDWRRPDVIVNAEGRPRYGSLTAVVRTADATIVVDPASWCSLGADGRVGDDSRPLAMVKAFLVGYGVIVEPRLPVEEGLAALHICPEDVTHVVLTHGHPDHLCGVVAGAGAARARFPDAEHLLPAADWQQFVVAKDHGGDAVEASLMPAADAGLVRLVEGETQVVDGVRLLPAVGHTAGHQIVRIGSAERLYYLGDLFHTPAEIEHPDWASGNPPAFATEVVSRERIFADADDQSAFVFTHGAFPGWGKVEQRGRRRWWRYE